MDVQEIMVEKVVSIRADATVKDAVNLMNQHDIGCLIVDGDGGVQGIITERDILKRVVAKSKDAEQTKVSGIMSKPLIIGGTTMYIEDAAKLIEEGKFTKPFVIYLGGKYMQEETRFGHAGAIISRGRGTTQEKEEILRDAGAYIVDHLGDIGEAVKKAISEYRGS